jgi:hypothetical protein
MDQVFGAVHIKVSTNTADAVQVLRYLLIQTLLLESMNDRPSTSRKSIHSHLLSIGVPSVSRAAITALNQ